MRWSGTPWSRDKASSSLRPSTRAWICSSSGTRDRAQICRSLKTSTPSEREPERDDLLMESVRRNNHRTHCFHECVSLRERGREINNVRMNENIATSPQSVREEIRSMNACVQAFIYSDKAIEGKRSFFKDVNAAHTR